MSPRGGETVVESDRRNAERRLAENGPDMVGDDRLGLP